MGEDFAGLCEKVNNFSMDGIFASDTPYEGVPISVSSGEFVEKE